jgi:parallel beta-helix repeat protein
MDQGSNGNNISNNSIELNSASGVLLQNNENNLIINNILIKNYNGIFLDRSYHINIKNNLVSINNKTGIYLDQGANNNIIENNEISSNQDSGIKLSMSDENLIRRNSVINNNQGIWLGSSYDNKIFHNNFIDNEYQVFLDTIYNIWNDSYPNGGNYWSDYNGTDLFKGPNQTISGSDGIGDTPKSLYYVETKDFYPLMNPIDQKIEIEIDLDFDEIPDVWEIKYELNTTDPFDAHLDFDKDNLTNLEEYLYQTDPLKVDSDYDGFNDGFEVYNGTDPLNKDDHPELDEPKPDKNKTTDMENYFIYIISGISIIIILIIFGILINMKYGKRK